MIYVGTCGYAYKDWIGPFYPGTIKTPEMLGFYARRFSAVEIDASYYGVLAERTVAGMASRTPQEFRFCFKVPKSVTHPPGGRSAQVHNDALLFRASLEPMLAARKLGAVLLQFPNGFKLDRENERYLRAVADALDGLPLVAEFRHRDWQRPTTHELLRELNVGWCNVDMPQLDTLLHPSSDVAGSVGYVRFHGRNGKQWWTGNSLTRYAYTYSPDELNAWTDRVAEIESAAETTFAFFNNHARGSAAQNAEMFERMLEQRYGDVAASVLASPSAPPPAQPGLPGFE